MTLATRGALPDHRVFALAGTFLDRDAQTGCAALGLSPPVNAGYALIDGNWQARPHGFYFERLADALVYDAGASTPAVPPAGCRTSSSPARPSRSISP